MGYALDRYYEYEMTFTISDAYINYELFNELCYTILILMEVYICLMKYITKLKNMIL